MSALQSRRPLQLAAPVLALHSVPLAGAAPLVRRVLPGATIASHAPAGVVVCKLNGQWLLREHWQRPVLPGDVLEFHELPQDKGSSRTALTLALIIVAPQLAEFVNLALFQAGSAAAFAVSNAVLAAGIVVVGSQLINALIPLDVPSAGAGVSASPTYNVALSGNQARPDQPIPDLYGRHLTYPSFAAQPYSTYDADGIQYYHALMCVGQGTYTFERVTVDDTPIDHFQDIQYAQLGPGVQPTLVLANVVTAPEVTGQTLETGQYVGGYAASGPTLLAESIGVDIACPRGLGLFNSSGDVGNKTINWRVEVRTVSDFGVPLTAWEVVGTESLTLATVDVVRRSYTYTLAAPARVEVRVVRTDAKDENQKALHDLVWAGLRAYLDQTAPLCPTATHIEVKLKASEQLSGLSQRRIAVLAQRWLRSWTPEDGWGDEAPTRSIAWALANKWTSSYGDNLPDDRCDLATLYELHQVWEERQDRFDYVFDVATDSMSADQLIAAAGRARVFRRHGIRTIIRDEWDDLPVTLYGARDIIPGSLSIDYVLATSKTPDGVIVEYFDGRAWDWRPVECPAPGYSATTVGDPLYNAALPAMSRPEIVRLPGITGATHARREGLKIAAETFHRRKFVSFTTELQGMLPTFGSSVLIAPALAGWGQSGDVAAFDGATLVLTLTEPPAWTDNEDHYLILQLEDGSLTTPMRVLPGPGPLAVQLLADPGILPVTDAPDRERTRYHFGTSSLRILAKVLSIRPSGKSEGGAPLVQITCVADDIRVHQADNALLPGPGDEQDPVTPEDAVGGGTGGGTLLIVNLPDQFIVAGQGATLALLPDGTLEVTLRSVGGTTTTLIANRWLLGSPWEPADVAADGFEVQFTRVDTPNALVDVTGAFDTWLTLDTTRSVVAEFATDPTTDVYRFERLRVQVRYAASGLVQANALVTINLGENIGE